MERTLFNLELGCSLNASSPHLEEPVSEFTDIVHLDKHAFPRARGPSSKRVYGKNINQRKYLEIIPEASTNGVTNLDNVSESDDVQSEKSVKLNVGDDLSRKRKPIKTNAADLSDGREIFQRYRNLNCLQQAEKKPLNDAVVYSEAFRSNEAFAPMSTMALKNSFNVNSMRNNSEIKSGVLVWISHGNFTNSTRNSRHKSNLVNDNCTSSNSSNAACRIPVMVKVYQSSSGHFALMSPSRSHQGRTQPYYLRLRNSQVNILDKANNSPNDTPCCFLLTLSDRVGKSFKFEANSKTSAEAWVRVFSVGTLSTLPLAETVKTALVTTAMLPALSEKEDITNTERGNLKLDNNNNNSKKDSYDNCSVIESSGLANSSSSFTMSKTFERVNINHFRSLQESQAKPCFLASENRHFNFSAFQKERRMPTLSESSDETEDDLSEED
ncbi:hypothetical protein ElyMa_004309600 [Elysia marginata]|uniref:PH domain-containing protein n=1 Tax=Elysia marginata TaxID=1093978 RepID=A0AAV4GY70_9GAST|nr:hypothetical protein ElyMa_004309600 [Elysia marginata]